MLASPSPDPSVLLASAARLLARSRRLLVLTGAGSSADSGIPTFRCEGGWWRTHRLEDLASLAGFERDPELVWDWYRLRREQIASAEPHPGQRAIALLQRHLPSAVVLVATTNEDDLLERAGVRDVVHLHGRLFDTACVAGCGWRANDDLDNALSLLPCPSCGAPVRPGSTWYGEALPRTALERVAQFEPDACLVIGSSSLVQPVAGVPFDLLDAGHPVIELTLDPTPLTARATISLSGRASVLLPPLVDLSTSSVAQDQARRIT